MQVVRAHLHRQEVSLEQLHALRIEDTRPASALSLEDELAAAVEAREATMAEEERVRLALLTPSRPSRSVASKSSHAPSARHSNAHSLGLRARNVPFA